MRHFKKLNSTYFCKKHIVLLIEGKTSSMVNAQMPIRDTVYDVQLMIRNLLKKMKLSHLQFHQIKEKKKKNKNTKNKKQERRETKISWPSFSCDYNSIRFEGTNRQESTRKEEAVSRSRNSLKRGLCPARNLAEISFLHLSWIFGDASLPPVRAYWRPERVEETTSAKGKKKRERKKEKDGRGKTPKDGSGAVLRVGLSHAADPHLSFAWTRGLYLAAKIWRSGLSTPSHWR